MNKKSVLSLLFVCMSLSGMAQGFIHPGILHTQADFDRVKEKLATGQEPWTAAYNKLMTSKHVDLNWKPNPTVKIIRGGWNVWEPEGDNYGAAMNDAATAYQCALVWRITGDERYAEKSVEIMNAWARTCKKVSGNSNGSLASGLYGYEFANAGELMRDYEGWNREDFKRYQQWMLRVFSDQSFGFLQERHGCADDHYWSNWGLCNVLCEISVGILCDDIYVYNAGMEYYKYMEEHRYAETLRNLVWKLHKDDRGPFGYFGQMQESNRDQGHASMAVVLAADVCGAGLNQGDDLYAYMDDRIATGFEYVAAYNTGEEGLPNSPYTNSDGTFPEMGYGGRGTNRCGWPRIVNYYENIRIKSELQVVYDKYVGTTGDVTEALQVVSETVKSANAARALTMALNNAVKGAEAYWAKVENGEVTLNTALKTSLQQQISEAKKQLAETNMADMVVGAEESTTKLNAMVVSARNWAGLSYALGKAKALADRLGGLENTDEYKKVLADLDAVELTFDDAILDVAALNAKIQEKLTPEFLATVTEENKLDLTSFITNPNIFNNTGVKNQMPGGWILGRNDARDNTEWCTVTDGDGELHAGNWSGNKGNDVTGVHYYQKIGIGDGSVKLPDGLYQLAAATYSDGDPNKIVLYATSDSVNFDTVYFNRDRMLYDEALSKTDVTSTVEDVVVVGGQLYIGVRGSDPENNHQGGNGKNWYADNFRLYFAGKDVLGAYRGRLQDRLDKAVVLHDSLTVYGIDDSESYGFALDPEEGYYLFLTEGTLDDVSYAINDLDKMNADAEKLIANYLLLTPLVQNGNNFNNQLNEGVLFAQPTAKKTFIAALETAAEVAEDMTWDNYLSDAVVEQAEALKVATTEFMNSVALCFPMGTAKVLADQIGGLAQTEAYLNVMTYLASDELDPLDVDLAVQALQGECINAMTPEVLARATVDEPFDMTTFVVNPNIYQDATDDEGNPTDIRINGWTLETNADRAPRTGATSGDTWMYTTSHSSNDAHNISSATDYRQVIGTQPEVSAEGKYGLPTGAYRVEAATFLNHEWDKMRLYAQTNSVEVSTVTGSAGQDSTVYAYTEIEYADSAFNGKQDVWDAAQATLGTTTVVPEIYVENGAVTIGIRGNGRVGGNDSWFLADNFRLYYVGTERGSNIGGTMVGRNDNLSELVDVYDITGKLVRKQAKRADAVKGLKKGIYIAGGKKYVVTGN